MFYQINFKSHFNAWKLLSDRNYGKASLCHCWKLFFSKPKKEAVV